jgi:D-apiose dehydrogenase
LATARDGEGGRPLRVAMVGAGMISAFHLRAWKSVPGAELVAVVDPDAARAEARAREFGIGRCHPDVSALLAADPPDAIDVASPRETHGGIVVNAIDRGIHALCQKPLVPTLAEAERLVASLEGRARVMVNQNFRFRPYYQCMAQWIAKGRLGAITGCTIACRSSGLLPDADGRYPYVERQPFTAHESRLMIEEVLIHRIDVARWLCGPLRVVAARTRRSCPALAGESEASILLETEHDGVAVMIDGNFGAAGFPAQSRDRVEVVGTLGRIDFENDVLRLHGPQPEEFHYQHAVAYQRSFDAAAAHFARCLRTGEPFLTDARDNLETIRLVEAAYAAAGEPAH